MGRWRPTPGNCRARALRPTPRDRARFRRFEQVARRHRGGATLTGRTPRLRTSGSHQAGAYPALGKTGGVQPMYFAPHLVSKSSASTTSM